MGDMEHVYCKSIVRTSNMLRFGMHGHRTRHHTNDSCDDCTLRFMTSKSKCLISEDILLASSLHYNHYSLQSWEAYESKIFKGDGLDPPERKVHGRSKARFLNSDAMRNSMWDAE